MPDEILDPAEPPEEPPDDPSTETVTEPSPSASVAPAGAAPPVTAPAPAAIFSDEQIGRLATGISSGLLNGLRPPEAPAGFRPPTGPTPVELEGQIKALGEQIDLAVTEGKPIGNLIAQRDTLRDQKFQIERVDPLRQQGSTAINGMAINTAKRERAELFRLYDKEIMALLNPSIEQGFILTDKIVEEACNLVAGRHQKELFQLEQEAVTRQKKLELIAPQPGATSGRARTTAPKPPETIRERFGVNADEAFNSKRNKGFTEDTFARRMGYKDKADWFAQDEAMAATPTLGLDSVWDRKNNRWVSPDELNEFYNA